MTYNKNMLSWGKVGKGLGVSWETENKQKIDLLRKQEV